MRILKYIVGVVVLLLGILLLAGFLLGPDWRVERSADVGAPPNKVMAYISMLPNWPEWTVWNSENYPGMKLSYSGPNWGVGAQQSWDDGQMVGILEVTGYDPASYLEYNVEMDHGKYMMQCRIEVAPLLASSRVSWSCWGDSGSNPVDRLLMVVYKPLIGNDFEVGLSNLQSRFAKKDKS